MAISKKTTKDSGIKSPSMDQERRWQIESAMSTLSRADEIRNDKALMGDVKKATMQLAKSVMGKPVVRRK